MADLKMMCGRLHKLPRDGEPHASLADFGHVGAVDRRSRLAALGYFMLIERHVTHAPKPGDPYDTLTRQVSAKMSFLSKRMHRSLRYDAYFSAEVAPETLWKRLYGYRSALAHGTRPSFERGDFQVLRGEGEVLQFLRHATRELLRLVVSEPSLVSDLKVV